MVIQSASDIPTFKWGTITGVNPIRVKLDGDSAALALIPDSINGEYLTGDRVRVELSKNRVIIHGTATPRPLATATNLTTENLNNINYPGTFVQLQNGNATVARNYPAARAGYLESSGNRGSSTAGGGYQRYVDYQEPRRVWVRTKVSGTWGDWVLESDASGPSSLRTGSNFKSTYWRMWFDTDTNKMMVGDKSGGWRLFTGSATAATKAWDTTQAVTGMAMAGRTEGLTIPTVLEAHEELILTARSIGSGYGFVSLTGITRNPTNTIATVRFMQIMSTAQQSLVVTWQIAPGQ